MRRLIFILLLLVSAVVTRAQTVRWELSDTGDPADLDLVYENCEPTGDLKLPAIPGVNFTLTGGPASMTSINNFTVTRSTVMSLHVRSQRGGSVQIPSFVVDTSKGQLRVAAFTTGSAPALDTSVNSLFTAPSLMPWQGEVFPLTYTLAAPRRTFSQLGSAVPEWNAVPLIVEEWSKPEPVEFTSAGEARLNILYKTRAYAKNPGRFTINPARQLVNLQTGTVAFGIFTQPRLEQVTVTSSTSEFNVRPLPPGAPPSFNGAVGQFTLASNVVPTTAAVGEPVTWTLTLAGTGNWPDVPGLPTRDVSRDFQVIQPQAKRSPTEGKLFDATLAEDVVLVPSRPGSYTLGPITYTYFNPKTGSYSTVTTEKVTVTITAAPAPQINPVPATSDNSTAGPDSYQPPQNGAKPPQPPGAIPRDPLPAMGTAFSPISASYWIGFIAAPFGLLLVGWLALALHRARFTDPVRARREARMRLQKTLAELRSVADQKARTRLILQWQHDTTRLWEVSHAAAPSSLFTDAAWAQLWSEADRALYAGEAVLPSDWLTRADSALQTKRLNSFSAFQLFQPGNLLPFLVLAVAYALALPLVADPAADYREGKFADAEKAWRTTLQQEPTDWAARHNLALSLAQQDHWDEAAAHTAIAFVQHPRDSSVRWHIGPVFDKAGYVPEALAAFVNPGPVQSIARFASPAEWQLGTILAAAVIAAALALWLGVAFGWHAGWALPTAVSALVVGLLLGAISILSFHAYGPTADTHAVLAWRSSLLRSIPTDADTTQKTSTLNAGSVAVVDHTFLGWVRLAFPNGQTGWVRKEEVIPIWGAK